jgi:hypothetical protein
MDNLWVKAQQEQSRSPNRWVSKLGMKTDIITADSLIQCLASQPYASLQKRAFAELLNDALRTLPLKENGRMQLALDDLVLDAAIEKARPDISLGEARGSEINNQGPYHQTLYLLEDTSNIELLKEIGKRLE